LISSQLQWLLAAKSGDIEIVPVVIANLFRPPRLGAWFKGYLNTGMPLKIDLDQAASSSNSIVLRISSFFIYFLE